LEKLIKAEEEKIIYADYNSIADPHYNLEQLNNEYEKIKLNLASAHWKNNDDALEQLRVLSKYYFEFLSARMNELNESFIMSIESLRSGIAKLALLFLQELVGIPGSVPRGLNLSSYLPNVIPLLFHKLLDAKKFIVKEVDICLRNIVNSSISEEVINIICEQSFAAGIKNAIWTDNVFKYLELLVTSYAGYPIIPKCKDKLFTAFGTALETGRKPLIKRVNKMISEIKVKEGIENVLNNIKTSNIKETHVQMLIDVLQEKVAHGSKPEGGIKAFIQNMKGQSEDKK